MLIVGFLDRDYRNKSLGAEIFLHDVGLEPVPYTGRKFFLSGYRIQRLIIIIIIVIIAIIIIIIIIIIINVKN